MWISLTRSKTEPSIVFNTISRDQDRDDIVSALPEVPRYEKRSILPRAAYRFMSNRFIRFFGGRSERLVVAP
jgi:hypothetical protein